MSSAVQKTIRHFLGILLLVLAINAFGGGFYGMAGANNVSIEWLKGSPFKNYFIPGLVLFLLVGGTALLAAILVFKQHPMARKATLSCGVILLLWLGIQVSIIGYVSWMQPTTTVVAVMILLLSWKLPKYGH